MLRHIALGMICLLALSPATAMAASDDAGCKLRIESLPAEWRVPNVDVFGTDPTLATFQVQLVNSYRAALYPSGRPVAARGQVRAAFARFCDHRPT